MMETLIQKEECQMKKNYTKPELKTHGKLETITQGGPIGGEDEFNAAS